MLRSLPHARRLSALVLGTALLAGCGGGGDGGAKAKAGPAADTLVAASAAKSSGAGSSKISLISATKVNGTDVAFSGDGTYDYVKKSGQLSFKVPGADGSASSGGTIEERILGDALYLQLPQQPTVFYKLKLSDVAGTSLGGSTDPTASLAALQAVSDVKEVGKEKVRDADTTHYAGTYDVKKAVALAQGSAKTVLQSVLRGADLATVPFDAYLDGEGRLVKFVQKVELPAIAATGGKPVTSETTLELYDFGTDVAVVAPPAASVRDGAPLLAALKSASPSARKDAPTAAPTASPAG